MNRFSEQALLGAALLTMAAFGTTSVMAGQSAPRINPNPTLPQADVVVYTESVLDFGAQAGNADFDNTAAFQAAIDMAHGNGGGIVYVPAGIYHFAGNLVLKTGITLRGEWRDPDVPGQEQAAGSILAIVAGHGNAKGKPFLAIRAGAAVRSMSFWYPKQSFEQPVPYPWTIDASAGGPEMVRITLYNSFRGIWTGNTEMAIIHLRATCLAQGSQVHGAGNWAWYLDDRYASKYWTQSALPGSPANEEQAAKLRDYMRRHLTAMTFKVAKSGTLVDGGNIYDLRVEDAHTALATHWTWFQAINVQFKNVRVGWHGSPSSGHGRRGGDAKLRVVGGAIDVLPGKDTCGVKGDCGIYLHGVTIKGSPALAVDARHDATLLQCRFENWTQAGVRAAGGTPIIAGCAFGAATGRDIVLAPGVSQAVIAGNTFAGQPDIARNEASSGIAIDHAPLDIPDLPIWATTYELSRDRKPTQPDKLFPVTDFGAKAGDQGKTDCTEAFRKALAAARATGGGTVFVPGGWWRLDGQITVPSGVDLRGCGAGMHTKVGTTLFSYAHKGNEKGDPFITLEAESGLRDLIVYYPGMGKGRNVVYPWAIRGTGKGIQVRDVRLANPWNGIDLGTHRCDDFVLTRLIGDVRRNAIFVSGGTTGGRIEYTGWWWTGDFLGFPNGPTGYSDKAGEVNTSTTWPIRMGHARDITLLFPNTYQGSGPNAALMSFIHDGGVATDIKVIGPEADAFPFLRAERCGNLEIVSAGTYGSLVYSAGGNVSMHGTGWVGDVRCDGGRLNLYGIAGLGQMTLNGGEIGLYGARAVGNVAPVGFMGSSQGRIAACAGIEARIRTPHDIEARALTGSSVHRLDPGVLDSCDSPVGWSGSGPVQRDTKDHKEGTACLSIVATGADGKALALSRTFGTVDTGVSEQAGALRLWLYVSDASKLTREGSIELTSSGTYDRDEYSWNVLGLGLKDGWNDLTLKLSKAHKVGKPNPRNLRYFRVYSFVSEPVTLKLDHVRVEAGGQGR